MEFYNGTYFFAKLGVGDGEGESLLHIGMREQGFIDFSGGDFFAAPVDQLFEAAG